MGPGFADRATYGEASPRRRATGAVVTVLVHIVLLIAFLTLAPPIDRKPAERKLQTFDLPPSPEPRAERRSRAAVQRTTGGAPPKPAAPAPPPPPVPVPARPWVVNPDLAGFDLSQGKRSSPSPQIAAAADDGAGTGTGTNDGSAADLGPAPGGGRLYAASWYREPTRAEMITYLPRRGQLTGWGEVACRMVERYHVEDCQEHAEYPRGSGFARALREASFQLLVRPPRLNGKALVGTWVLIRYEVRPPEDEAGGR